MLIPDNSDGPDPRLVGNRADKFKSPHEITRDAMGEEGSEERAAWNRPGGLEGAAPRAQAPYQDAEVGRCRLTL